MFEETDSYLFKPTEVPAFASFFFDLNMVYLASNFFASLRIGRDIGIKLSYSNLLKESEEGILSLT